MRPRARIVAALAGLALLDTVVPIPFLALLLIYVALTRPPWFTTLVNRVYATP